jgi:hypothetical protein
MRKSDQKTKAGLPRVLTDAEVDTLSVSQIRKLLREGRAVLDRDQVEKEIAEELASLGPKKPTRGGVLRRPTVN